MARGRLEMEEGVARDLMELGLEDRAFAEKLARVWEKDHRQVGVLLLAAGYRVVKEVDEKTRKEVVRIRRWPGIDWPEGKKWQGDKVKRNLEK